MTLYTAGHLHTAVPHCSHSRAPIVHTAVPGENNEHGCVYLRCRAVCKLPGCVEGHPWLYEQMIKLQNVCVCMCKMTNLTYAFLSTLLVRKFASFGKIRSKYVPRPLIPTPLSPVYQRQRYKPDEKNRSLSSRPDGITCNYPWHIMVRKW